MGLGSPYNSTVEKFRNFVPVIPFQSWNSIEHRTIMPRKAFVADLNKAADLRIDHISEIKAGDEDGTITFSYHDERYAPTSQSVRISAIIPGTKYPSF